MYDFDAAEKKLQTFLEHKRFTHSLAVMYTATAMAMAYGFDPERARIAGLLHDCAKRLPKEEQIRICKEFDVGATEFEIEHPHLLHGKAGVYLAEKEFGISDKEILSAIAWHTTGKSAMTDLEKIIYIADYIEPWRDQMPNLQLIRRLAFCDMDSCILHIINDTIEYLNHSGRPIDAAAFETQKYYQMAVKEKENGSK